VRDLSYKSTNIIEFANNILEIGNNRGFQTQIIYPLLNCHTTNFTEIRNRKFKNCLNSVLAV